MCPEGHAYLRVAGADRGEQERHIGSMTSDQIVRTSPGSGPEGHHFVGPMLFPVRELRGVPLRQTEMVRHFGVLAVLLAALVSCSEPGASGGVEDIDTADSASTDQSTMTTTGQVSSPVATTAGPPPIDAAPSIDSGELIEPVCDDDSACASGFYLDGVFFGLDCTAIRADAVTTDVVGVGTVTGQQVTANEIADIDPSSFVAVDLPGGGACYEEDPSEPTSPWSLAIRQDASAEQIRDTVCRVADYTPERRQTNDCDPLN